ncbi:hypothetical protein IHQ72_35920 (plasmid) [Mesorhizobium onobrychidis]|uniref:Transposase n=1 Tax=Mesorhizobium onobrychidis TaxID=2775404 RepID=A0ABY5R722_9HYPH|nr:hypothetical protein IHQ72_35920 [Mesorhizobium onobrychidis]
MHDGQRVLALTFMHGARRRLNEKLRGIEGLRGKTECMTVDSFAQRLVRRWRGLASVLDDPPTIGSGKGNVAERSTRVVGALDELGQRSLLLGHEPTTETSNHSSVPGEADNIWLMSCYNRGETNNTLKVS